MTDIFADKTVLLLAAKDGLMQDLTGRHTFEAVGSVPLDNGRAVFDGNGYLHTVAHDDFNLAAGDFTVEVQCPAAIFNHFCQWSALFCGRQLLFDGVPVQPSRRVWFCSQ